MKLEETTALEEKIWTACRDDLLRFLMARTDDTDLAQELVHETLLKAFEARASLRDVTRLKPWLFSIARNALIDKARHRRRYETFDETRHQLPADEPEPEPHLGACLAALVQQLPPRYRDALVLSELQDTRQREVAERLGLTLSGAKSRVQRGRRLLRERLFACCPLEFDTTGRPVACGSCG